MSYSLQNLFLELSCLRSKICSFLKWSKEELFCALPSATSLPLVTSSFGDEIGNSLFELHFAEGLLKLSGYLSSHACPFSYKVIPYSYLYHYYFATDIYVLRSFFLIFFLQGNFCRFSNMYVSLYRRSEIPSPFCYHRCMVSLTHLRYKLTTYLQRCNSQIA